MHLGKALHFHCCSQDETFFQDHIRKLDFELKWWVLPALEISHSSTWTQKFLITSLWIGTLTVSWKNILKLSQHQKMRWMTLPPLCTHSFLQFWFYLLYQENKNNEEVRMPFSYGCINVSTEEQKRCKLWYSCQFSTPSRLQFLQRYPFTRTVLYACHYCAP